MNEDLMKSALNTLANYTMGIERHMIDLIRENGSNVHEYYDSNYMYEALTRDFYRAIASKETLLLYGCSARGRGKTTNIQNIAKEHDVSIYTEYKERSRLFGYVYVDMHNGRERIKMMLENFETAGFILVEDMTLETMSRIKNTIECKVQKSVAFIGTWTK